MTIKQIVDFVADGANLVATVGPCVITGRELPDDTQWEVSVCTANQDITRFVVPTFWNVWKVAVAVQQLVDYMNGDN